MHVQLAFLTAVSHSQLRAPVVFLCPLWFRPCHADSTCITHGLIGQTSLYCLQGDRTPFLVTRYPSSSLTSAMQHYTSGPPSTSSSSSATQAPDQPSGPPATNLDAAVVNTMSSENSRARSGTDYAAYGLGSGFDEFMTAGVMFTTVPSLGSYTQPLGHFIDPVTGQLDVSLSADAATVGKVEMGLDADYTVQDSGRAVTAPMAAARRNALEKLASNSSVLAAAIAEADCQIPTMPLVSLIRAKQHFVMSEHACLAHVKLLCLLISEQKETGQRSACTQCWSTVMLQCTC